MNDTIAGMLEVLIGDRKELAEQLRTAAVDVTNSKSKLVVAEATHRDLTRRIEEVGKEIADHAKRSK